MELYAYYGRTQRMLENVLRDEETVPIVKEMLGGYRQYLFAARDILMQDRKLKGRARNRVRAAIGHALSFPAWRSLCVEQELNDTEGSSLMCRLVSVANH